MKIEKAGDTSASKREYSKAYYKRKVRTKVKITFELLTPGITQFLLENAPEMYIQLFGQDMNPLFNTETPEHLRKLILGVVRHANHISAVFLTDGSGWVAGDLNKLPLTYGTTQELAGYNIHVGYNSEV